MMVFLQILVLKVFVVGAVFFESKDGQEEEVDTNMRSEPTGGGPMHGRRVPDPVRRPCCRVVVQV